MKIRANVIAFERLRRSAQVIDYTEKRREKLAWMMRHGIRPLIAPQREKETPQ